MIINEQKKAFDSYGQEMAAKWGKILESDGGIGDQYIAEQTAILMQNYLNHLEENPVLVAEDEIQSGNFKGVNLALMGLLKRAIPKFVVGTDLVGLQSMPTPSSPIFYMRMLKSMDAAFGEAAYKEFSKDDLNPKGDSQRGDELWGYPGSTDGFGDLSDIDPYFTLNKVRSVNIPLETMPAVSSAKNFGWTPLIPSSVRLVLHKKDWTIAKGTPVGFPSTNPERRYVVVELAGDYSGITNLVGTPSFNDIDGIVGFNLTVQTLSVLNTGTPQYEYRITVSGAPAADVLAEYDLRLEWEYFAEANSKMPEITTDIISENVELQKRNLRGKYTFDAMTDSKVLHGINLESELMDTMRLELTNEMSREILRDLMALAAIRKTIDLDTTVIGSPISTSTNYQDKHVYVLDFIGQVCSEIWVQGRLGRGNWVVGNPTTLTLVERVAGFRESGVDYDASTLTFKGKLGKIKFYEDPQFPKDKLLIGYKGISNLETGYIFAPYQPIVAMPTLMDPMTGDYRKIFQTRYGKSFQFKKTGEHQGTFRNAIYRGAYQYAVVTLKNWPTVNQ